MQQVLDRLLVAIGGVGQFRLRHLLLDHRRLDAGKPGVALSGGHANRLHGCKKRIYRNIPADASFCVSRIASKSRRAGCCCPIASGGVNFPVRLRHSYYIERAAPYPLRAPNEPRRCKAARPCRLARNFPFPPSPGRGQLRAADGEHHASVLPPSLVSLSSLHHCYRRQAACNWPALRVRTLSEHNSRR